MSLLFSSRWCSSEIKVKYAGDLAQNDTSLITRTIITNILKEDLGNEVNIINALAILNQQGVTYNIKTKETFWL